MNAIVADGTTAKIKIKYSFTDKLDNKHTYKFMKIYNKKHLNYLFLYYGLFTLFNFFSNFFTQWKHFKALYH